MKEYTSNIIKINFFTYRLDFLFEDTIIFSFTGPYFQLLELSKITPLLNNIAEFHFNNGLHLGRDL